MEADSGSASILESKSVFSGKNGRSSTTDDLVVAVEVPDLSDGIVIVSIEFDNLTVPSMVVDISPSDLYSFSVPSWNVIEDLPSLSNAWLLEVSVDSNVFITAISDHFNVVDCQAVAITFACSFE